MGGEDTFASGSNTQCTEKIYIYNLNIHSYLSSLILNTVPRFSTIIGSKDPETLFHFVFWPNHPFFA